MNKYELAKIVEESIKDKVKLMDCEGIPEELQPTFSNILYKPPPEGSGYEDLDPTIPIFIDTDKGVRKAFSITITAP